MSRKKVTPLKDPQGVNGSVATPQGGVAGVDTESRWHMISEAAFYRAEHRGFVGGDPEQDWYEAERAINDLIERQEGALSGDGGQSRRQRRTSA